MDKTLADYITRTMAKIELEKQTRLAEPVKNPDQYLVYPEIAEGADHKVNPFSQV